MHIIRKLMIISILYSNFSDCSRVNFFKVTFSQKEIYRLKKWTSGCQEEKTVREFGMVMYTLLYLKWKPARTYCTAHGTLLNDMWQAEWEESLGKNGYLYMYGWVSSLFTWNYHSINNWLYPKTKLKLKNKSSVFKPYLIKVSLVFEHFLALWHNKMC